ncbi:hypothetical protein D3C78_1638400 [compost metagenome]
MPGSHQLLLYQRRSKAAVLIEGVIDRLGDGVVDVLADQIGQLQWSHGETASIT